METSPVEVPQASYAARPVRLSLRRRGGGVPRWLFFAVGYALLIGAWALAGPPGSVPGEPAHLVRAAGLSQGEWEGERADPSSPQARQFGIPASLVPPPPCFAGKEDVAASCPEAARPLVGVSDTAAYSPLAYVPAALAVRLAVDWVQAIYLGRLALGLACALLLAAAAWVLGGRGSVWPMAGLVVATTPMAVFLGSGLTPLGLEVCAAICFAAALVAAFRGRRRPATLTVMTLSGAVVALSGPLGAFYVGGLLVGALPLLEERRLLGPWRLLLALLAVGTAVGFAVAWGLAHRPFVHRVPLAVLLAGAPDLLGRLPSLFSQAVGVFGWLDTALPTLFYLGWGLPLALLLATALMVGWWRERLALAFTIAGATILALAILGGVLPAAPALEGRHLLPLLVLVPITAGFALHRARLLPRSDPLLVGLAVGALQFAALWFNARRYAVGRHGALYFLQAPQWSPPEGWATWLVLGGLGSLLLALSLVPLTRAEAEAMGEEEDEAAGTSLVLEGRRVSVSR